MPEPEFREPECGPGLAVARISGREQTCVMPGQGSLTKFVRETCEQQARRARVGRMFDRQLQVRNRVFLAAARCQQLRQHGAQRRVAWRAFEMRAQNGFGLLRPAGIQM